MSLKPLLFSASDFINKLTFTFLRAEYTFTFTCLLLLLLFTPRTTKLTKETTNKNLQIAKTNSVAIFYSTNWGKNEFSKKHCLNYFSENFCVTPYTFFCL